MSNTKGFEQQFAKYTCDGDSITCTVDGFDVTATIYHDKCNDSPDERDNGFWPSLDPDNAGYIGAKSKSTLARHIRKAKMIMDAWTNDEWFYCGVAVTVYRRGVQLTDSFSHALWGIECNYPNGRKRANAYLRDVANELLPEALKDAENVLADLLKSMNSGKQASV